MADFKTLGPLVRELQRTKTFFQKITYDLQNSERNEPFMVGEKSISRLKKNHRYFDFFDAVLEVMGPFTREIVIFKSPNNKLSEPGFSEQTQIIDKLLLAFGEDTDALGRFDYHVHPVKHSYLMERNWYIDGIALTLGNFTGIDKYALTITLPLPEN
jgi:hypothetical protein